MKRTLKSAHSPIWANQENSEIALKCVFVELEEMGELPFLAQQSDTEAHGREIFTRAAAGEFGEVADYVPPVPSEAQALEACKAEAKARLEATDWAMLPDVTISNRAAFEAYRDTVRGLYITPVAEPVWPERPEAAWL